MRVLVADDEEIVRKTVVDFLQATGHCVRQVEDGIQALCAMETDQFDLLIADVRMPRMGGIALLTETQERYPGLPVIVMTGHGDENMTNELLALGARTLLTKPFRLKHLAKIVQELGEGRGP
jgi:DNA-binding NtrC family response regulator